VLDGVATVNLSESPDGRLWLDTHDRLIPVPPQHGGPLKPRPAWLAQAEGQESGLFDRDGNYWALACPVGVCRAVGVGLQPSAVMTPNAGPRDRLDQPWQVSSLTGNILFEDRDGNIWVGTQSGVERFRHNRLSPVGFAGGERFFSFATDDAGRALALALPNGHLWSLAADGTPQRVETLSPGLFNAIGKGADGALLVATPERIERRLGGKIERIDYPADPGAKPESKAASNTVGKSGGKNGTRVTRIVDDGAALWVSIARRGTFRLHDGKWSSLAELGLPPGVFFMAPGASGVTWLGYNEGVVARYDGNGGDGGRVTRYAPSADNDVGAVTFLRAEPAGVVVGGSAGLAVLRDGRWLRLRADDPDVLASVSGMVVGPNGERWLNGSKGVVQVTAAAWRAALERPDGLLAYNLFGVLDGYPGAATTASRQPTAIAGADGQLWFVGSGGVARLDTARSEPVPHSPQVRIETLVARGRRHLDFSSPLPLDAGTTSLRIEYTALSYGRPELVRFRYQLDGVDAGWQDAGARRAVSYNSLGPGEYRFRVAAVDELGRWNVEPAIVTMRIAPTFTQTPWFTGLCAALGAGVLYLLYRLWLKQATLRIAARVAERERIARTLHDTFLQSVQGLVLGFQSALNALPPESAARARVERVLLLADRVIEEGRDEVQELRSTAMSDDDLHRGLALVGEVLQQSHDSVFSLRQEGEPATLREHVACEAYRIGREALMNAFRHAQSRSVVVILSYDADQFRMQVSDDGRGIDADVLASGQRPGHWGLPGMAERAARIGGRLAIDNADADGGGARVTLTVPAPLAYAGQARWKRRLAALWRMRRPRKP
jgi:signal transduction histidine kinase